MPFFVEVLMRCFFTAHELVEVPKPLNEWNLNESGLESRENVVRRGKGWQRIVVPHEIQCLYRRDTVRKEGVGQQSPYPAKSP
jgi:hypothetical protein